MTWGMEDRDAELAIGVNVWMVQGTGELEVWSISVNTRVTEIRVSRPTYQAGSKDSCWGRTSLL